MTEAEACACNSATDAAGQAAQACQSEHALAGQAASFVEDALPSSIPGANGYAPTALILVLADLDTAGHEAEPHLVPEMTGIDAQSGGELFRIEGPIALSVAIQMHEKALH